LCFLDKHIKAICIEDSKEQPKVIENRAHRLVIGDHYYGRNKRDTNTDDTYGIMFLFLVVGIYEHGDDPARETAVKRGYDPRWKFHYIIQCSHVFKKPVKLLSSVNQGVTHLSPLDATFYYQRMVKERANEVIPQSQFSQSKTVQVYDDTALLILSHLQTD
jgi:hypothetical protein